MNKELNPIISEFIKNISINYICEINYHLKDIRKLKGEELLDKLNEIWTGTMFFISMDVTRSNKLVKKSKSSLPDYDTEPDGKCKFEITRDSKSLKKKKKQGDQCCAKTLSRSKSGLFCKQHINQDRVFMLAKKHGEKKKDKKKKSSSESDEE